MIVLSATTHSTGSSWGMFLFVLLLATYGGYILWAVCRREDDLDRDIKAAQTFAQKQEATGRAIGGGK
jgi:hypothetical protein